MCVLHRSHLRTLMSAYLFSLNCFLSVKKMCVVPATSTSRPSCLWRWRLLSRGPCGGAPVKIAKKIGIVHKCSDVFGGDQKFARFLCDFKESVKKKNSSDATPYGFAKNKLDPAIFVSRKCCDTSRYGIHQPKCSSVLTIQFGIRLLFGENRARVVQQLFPPPPPSVIPIGHHLSAKEEEEEEKPGGGEGVCTLSYKLKFNSIRAV